MRNLWNTENHITQGRTRPALYEKKLGLLGLVTVTLLAGGLVLGLPMHVSSPTHKQEASISLKNEQAESLQPANDMPYVPVSVTEGSGETTLTVNGQDIPVPDNGTTQQVVPSSSGDDITVKTDSSTAKEKTDSTTTSSSTVNIRATVEQSNPTGGTITIHTY